MALQSRATRWLPGPALGADQPSAGARLLPEAFHRMEDVDSWGLEALFRVRVFKLMVKKGKITPEDADGMRAWPHSGFEVSSTRRIEAEDRKGLEGLLTYMDRAPVSLRRLTYRKDEGMVHSQGTKFHPRLGTDHQLLTPVDFVALLVPHVLLRYEDTLRTYGAISTTFRKKAGWIEHPPVDKSTLPAPSTSTFAIHPQSKTSETLSGKPVCQEKPHAPGAERSPRPDSSGAAWSHGSRVTPSPPGAPQGLPGRDGGYPSFTPNQPKPQAPH